MSRTFDTKRLVAMQGQLVAMLKHGVQDTILGKATMLKTIIVVAGAVVSIVMIARILFLDTRSENVIEKQSVRLNNDVIDELELFIETRQTAYENPQDVSRKVFGL